MDHYLTSHDRKFPGEYTPYLTSLIRSLRDISGALRITSNWLWVCRSGRGLGWSSGLWRWRNGTGQGLDGLPRFLPGLLYGCPTALLCYVYVHTVYLTAPLTDHTCTFSSVQYSVPIFSALRYQVVLTVEGMQLPTNSWLSLAWTVDTIWTHIYPLIVILVAWEVMPRG